MPLYPANRQFEFFARLPAFASAQHPGGFRAFDIAADPGFENKIHHAADPPTFAGQGWYGIGEIGVAAELQQRVAVLRERHRLAAQFQGHSRIIEHSIASQIRHEDFHQRSNMPDRALAMRRQIERGGKRPLQKRQKDRAALVLCRGQRFGDLAEGLRVAPRRKMISVVLRVFFHDAKWQSRRPQNPHSRYRSDRVRRNGSAGNPARKTNARTMSNCVVSARRLSPSTILGRKIVLGASGRSSRIMCSQNFLVRA